MSDNNIRMFPKKVPDEAMSDQLTAREHVDRFMIRLQELIADGTYKPEALVVLVIQQDNMVPIGCNISGMDTLAYLQIAERSIVDGLIGR